MSDATKAFGQEVQTQSSDKFGSGQAHHFVEIGMSIVLVAEGNLPLVVANNSMMADGDVVGIASQITDKPFSAAKRRLGEDDPIFGLELSNQFKGIVQAQLVKQHRKPSHEHSFEDLAEGFNRKEELPISFGLFPLAGEANPAAGNDTMDMRMKTEIASPGM